MEKSSDSIIHTDPIAELHCDNCGADIDITDVESFAEFPCPQCQAALHAPAQFGNFRLLRVLGRGGMGSVFLAQDETLGRRVALKVMLKSLGDNPTFVTNFKREAQAAAKLNHPHIAQIYAFGQHLGQPYIVMELVSGKRFDDLVDAGDKMSPAFVMKIGADIAEGLRVAAAAGLVHGDIKPDNILLNEQMHAKLVDFGIASMTDEQSDEIWGTPYYIAPEKVRRQRIDLRTDIYSLGATLYHGLTGRPPFEGETPIDVVKARFQMPPKPLRESRPDIDPRIVSIIDRMLQLEPGMRYPTYESLLSDLNAYLASMGGADRIVSAGVGSSRRVVIRKKGAANGSSTASQTASRSKGLIVQRGSFGDPSRSSPGLTGSFESAYAAKPLPLADGTDVKAKPAKGLRWALLLLLILVAVGGAVWGGVYLAKRLITPEPEPAVDVSSPEVAVTAAAARDAALGPIDSRIAATSRELQSVHESASNVTARVWGPQAWADARETHAARLRAAAAATSAPVETAPATEPGTDASEPDTEPDASSKPATAADAVDPESIFMGRAATIHEAAPRVWSALLALETACVAVEGGLRVARDLRDDLAAADPVSLDAATLQLGNLAPPDSPLGRLHARVREAESALAEAQPLASTVERLVGEHVTRLQRDAERLEQEALLAREQAELARQEAAHLARVEAERTLVQDVMLDQAEPLRQRRYREARWAVRDLRERMRTDEGRAAVDVAMAKVDRLESLHNFLAEQIQTHGFPGGWVEGGRNLDVTADNPRAIKVGGREILWSEVDLAPTVRMIQYFLLDEQQSRQVRLRERVEQLINATLYSVYFGRGNPNAELFARTLAQRAIGLFPGAEALINDLDLDLGD